MERFAEKVNIGPERDDGLPPCHLWTSAADQDGYGLFQAESRRTVRAHRWIYEMTTGEEIGRLLLRHKCDTPGCVNPEHLIPGTGVANMRDMVERKRDARRRGELHHAAKMTQGKVDELLRRRAAGESVRSMHAEFGISYSQAKAIASGRKWKPLSE